MDTNILILAQSIYVFHKIQITQHIRFAKHLEDLSFHFYIEYLQHSKSIDMWDQILKGNLDM